MTFPTSTSSSCARKPIIENITKPAKNDVSIFEIATINASLKVNQILFFETLSYAMHNMHSSFYNDNGFINNSRVPSKKNVFLLQKK